MGALDSRGLRITAGAVAALGISLAAPMACFFPSYTYDLPAGAGGSGSTTSTTKGTGTGTSTTSMGMTSTTSTGMGGSSTTTTSTAPSSSSTSGATCSSMDCSDPACKGAYTCVPTAPPTGWTGYFALYDGAQSGYNGCGSAYPNSAYSGNNKLSFQPATCNCTCGSPTGQKCQMTGPADMSNMNDIDAIVSLDGTCGGQAQCQGPLFDAPTWTGSCDITSAYAGGTTVCGPSGNCQAGGGGTQPCNLSITANQLQVTGGSCTSNAQPPTLPPVTWGSLGAACGGPTPGMGCTDSADSCLPVPQGSFVGGVCIMQTGDVACPGGFADKHLFYGSSTLPGSMDSRACSTCGCDAPTGGTCSATVKVFSGGSSPAVCTTGTLVATLHPTTETADCVNTPSNPQVGSKQATFTAVTGGTCAPNSTPMGTVTTINPTTFCCSQ